MLTRMARHFGLHDSQPCMAHMPGGGGGGDSHMKQTGMLVVSLRGVNFGFWSRLGCSGQSACQYFKPPRSRLGFREETQNYAKRNRSQIFFLTCF